LNNVQSKIIRDYLNEFDSRLTNLQQILNTRIDSSTRETNTMLTNTITQFSISINQLLSNLTNSLKESSDKLQKGVEEKLEKIRASVEEKLGESIEKSFSAVKQMTEQLGDLKVSQERLIEIGKEINRLSDILQSPKMRGSFGEFQLETLLKQVIPQEFFKTQYQIVTGNIVDVAIFLKEGILCIDSKFPLSNFEKLTQPNLEEKEREMLARDFEKAVKKHIDDIAEKYIIPEKTLELAFMFIPAENVYYEILTRTELVEYARRKKVVPVSPNTLFAYLIIIGMGFRGMKIEQEARRIEKILLTLRKDFDGIREHFRTLLTHLERARNKAMEADKVLERFDTTIKGIEEGRKEIKEIPDVSKQV